MNRRIGIILCACVIALSSLTSCTLAIPMGGGERLEIAIPLPFVIFSTTPVYYCCYRYRYRY